MSVSIVLVSLMLATGCTDDVGPPPKLSLLALVVRGCLPTEPDLRGPCTEQALVLCPAEQTRAECLATTLDELAAADAHAADKAAASDRSLVKVAVNTFAVTAAVLVLLGWWVGRRTLRRNDRAFQAELPELATRGLAVSDWYSLPVPSDLARLSTVRRVLVRDADPRLWLIEREAPGTGINRRWPERYALWICTHPVPDGRLVPIVPDGNDASPRYTGSFADLPAIDDLEHLVRRHVDPWFPALAVLAADGMLEISTTPDLTEITERPPVPISLAALADLALAIDGDLRAKADGLHDRS
jgi:hypothetical protein